MDTTTSGRCRFVALALLLLCSATPVLSQGGRSDDNVLYPQPPLPLYVGPEGGYALWEDEADFSIGDGPLVCVRFTSGEGEGLAGGIRSMMYLTPWLVFSPRVRYELRPGTFISPLDTEPARDERDSVIMLEREAQLDGTFAAFTVDVRIALDLFETGIYLSAGPAASLMTGGSFDYRERITAPVGFRFSESGTNENMLASGRSFERYESFTFDVRGGLGYLLEIGRWAINPEVSYTFPLTSVLGSPELMKQTSMGGSLGILYNFGEVR